MTPEQRRPALGLLAAAAVLGLLGLLVGDERLAVLCWLLAAPMGVAGAVAIAWGNATAELRRLASRDD